MRSFYSEAYLCLCLSLSHLTHRYVFYFCNLISINSQERQIGMNLWKEKRKNIRDKKLLEGNLRYRNMLPVRLWKLVHLLMHQRFSLYRDCILIICNLNICDKKTMDIFENVSVLLQFAIQPITLQTLSNIRWLNNLFSMNSRFQLSGR